MDLSLRELAAFAKEFVVSLPQVSGTHAHVVGLSGELGAGKTTFVQMVARELGVTLAVQSPTFVIVRPYPITHSPFSRLVHIDAYRLHRADNDTISWGHYSADPTNLILVEWPERLPGFPEDAPTLTFSITGEETRAIHHVEDR